MPVPEGHKFMVPKKEIYDIGDMEIWLKSHAFQVRYFLLWWMP